MTELTCFKAHDFCGEILARQCFREFVRCDSVMIPWVLIAELLSSFGRSLGNWVKDRFATFLSSGEINFKVAGVGEVIEHVLSAHRADALSTNETDGASF